MEQSYKIVHEGSKKCNVRIGEWARVVEPYTAIMRTIAIADEEVAREFDLSERFSEVVTIRGGEWCKSLDVVAGLWKDLVEMGADRHTVLVAIGGGTITDLVGFVASTYMRGVKLILLPTTLLGQVDAAIGGKCGVNLGGYKNMVGTFNLPGDVVCDPLWLSTLPEKEWRAGMAEVIKTAILGDAELFELLENTSLDEVRSDAELCGQIVARTVAVKCRVVNEDFRESGLRRVLNLGHTLAHAIEALTREFSHGEAVAIGLAYVAKMAVEQGTLSEEDCGRIVALLERYGLPTTTNLPKDALHEAMLHDKKNSNQQIKWVVPTGIGTMPTF